MEKKIKFIHKVLKEIIGILYAKEEKTFLGVTGNARAIK